MPKVSVIVPVYKVEKYLNRCVNSILAQTFTDFELILVDDGSPDNCPKMCDEYAEKDERIRVIHKENGGVSSARNDGIDMSQGEWIMFVDSDDWIELNSLESLTNAILNDDIDMVVGGYKTITIRNEIDHMLENELLSKDKMKEKYTEIADKGNLILTTPWGKIFKTSVIRDYNISFDTTMKISEDTKFVLCFLNVANNVATVSDMIVNYNCKNGTSATNKYIEDFAKCKYFMYMSMREYLDGEKWNGYIEGYTVECVYSCLYHYIKYAPTESVEEKMSEAYNMFRDYTDGKQELLDKRFGGGYIGCIVDEEWKELSEQWKKRNRKNIIKENIKKRILKILAR